MNAIQAGGPSSDGSPAVARRRTVLGGLVLVAVLATLVAASRAAWVDTAPGDPSAGPRSDRIRALVLVATVCAASSLGGWIVARLGAADPALAVSRSLAAIVLRLLMPLALLGWLSADPHAWPEAGKMRDAGAGGLLVVFYLTLLATDILLHIMWGPKGPRWPPRSRRPAPASTPDS